MPVTPGPSCWSRAPRDRYRVDCELVLDLRVAPLATIGDVTVLLRVPVASERGRIDVGFEYAFVQEDGW